MSRVPPAATVPLVALAVKTPFPVLSPLHVSVLFPLLLRVSVVVVLVPTSTSPNAILPDSPRMRVDVGEGIGVWVGVGAVGGGELPPEQELVTVPTTSATRTATNRVACVMRVSRLKTM